MGDACEDCKSWEEQMFWTHFQTVHFTLFLRDDFLHQVALPDKFAKHFKTKLPEVVTLKGPSGFTWDVGLTGNVDSLFLDSGWSTFVKDHALNKNDVLIFKYNGVSHFDVLVVDGLSLCEKATSYFVRKCGHNEHDSGSQTKRKAKENSMEIRHVSPQDCLDDTADKSAENDVDPTYHRRTLYSTPTNKRMRGSISRMAIEKKSGNKYTSPFVGQELLGHDSELASPDSGSPLLTSHGRLVTEEQKRNALMLAQSAVSSDGFILAMRPTHVKRKFFMSIPSPWMTKYMSLELQDVTLRLNGKTWQTKFHYYPSRSYGGLSGGWRSFVADNSLDEFDVCVFECDDPAAKPLTLDVKIFPVIQAVVPLTEVKPDLS